VGRVGRHPGSGWSVAAALSIAAALTPPTPAAAAATPITLSPIATGFTNPIGLDYYQPSNKLAMSVNWPGGSPYNFVLVAEDGSQSQFSTISGLTDEVYLSAIHAGPCQGGFVTGDVYVGTGTPGVIAKVTEGGSTLIDPWVTLPGESGLLRGGLFQDRFCAAGGDLVVTTTAGDVWRITSGGTATEVAAGVGDWLEGPTTVPNDPRYGPWAGKILAASEDCGCVRSVDPGTGLHETWSLGLGNMTGSGVASAEGVHVVPANQNFYGVDFGSGTLVGAPSSQFGGVVGDVVVATEFPGRLVDVTWDPITGTFGSRDLLATNARQFEGTTFAPIGIPPIPPAPPPIPPSVMQATGLAVSGYAGFPLAAPVATFSDTDLSATPGEFSATVDWGDRQNTPATVMPTSSASPASCVATTQASRCFLVYGRHSYERNGDFVLAVTVTKVNGQTANATGSAKITRSARSPVQASEFGWEVSGYVSADRGLVISDTFLNEFKLGRREMADDMSIPYVKVSTSSSPAVRRLTLSPAAVELAADGSFLATSRLISGPVVSARPSGAAGLPGILTIAADYRLDLSPDPSGRTSWLEVFQIYQFHQEMADTTPGFPACEPSQEAPIHFPPLNCARWKPIVQVRFHPGDNDALLSVNVVQRMHFRPDAKTVAATTLAYDCDNGVEKSPAGDTCQPTIPPFHLLALYRDQNPIQNEAVVRAIKQNQPGDYDNLHLTWHGQVGLPLPLPPGCPECVHMHWRWGLTPSGGNPLFGNGQPLLTPELAPAPNPKSDQSLDVALVTFHDGEESPRDLRDLVEGLPANGYGGGTAALADPVVFLSATATDETSDIFFAFGGFFGSQT
jgi:hypothetical protein